MLRQCTDSLKFKNYFQCQNFQLNDQLSLPQQTNQVAPSDIIQIIQQCIKCEGKIIEPLNTEHLLSLQTKLDMLNLPGILNQETSILIPSRQPEIPGTLKQQNLSVSSDSKPSQKQNDARQIKSSFLQENTKTLCDRGYLSMSSCNKITIGKSSQIKMPQRITPNEIESIRKRIKKQKIWDFRNVKDETKLKKVYKDILRKIGKIVYNEEEFLILLQRTNYDIDLIQELIQQDSAFMKYYYEMRMSNIKKFE